MILIWPSNDNKIPEFYTVYDKNGALRIDLSIERESRKKNNGLRTDIYDMHVYVFPANYELL